MRRPGNHFVGPMRSRPRRRRARPFNRRFATRPPLPRSSARPRTMIPRDVQAQMYNKAENMKSVASFYDVTGDSAKSDSSSNSVCEVIEVLMFDEQAAGQGGHESGCNPTSNPFEDQDDPLDVCNSCGHCVHCLVQHETLKSADDSDRTSHVAVGHFSAFDKSIGQDDQNGKYTMTKTGETLPITNLDEGPILVDLTSDETNVKSEPTLLTRPCDIEDVTGTYNGDDTEDWNNVSESKSRESSTMIADSSNRLHRGNAGSSMATALRDRGPCVIPMQPNRSLPIRPAPPVPMRATTLAKPRTTPTLKVSNELSVHVVEVESSKPMSTCLDSVPNEENGFSSSDQTSRDDCKILSIDSFLPSEASNGARSITLKRKVSEGREKEAERDAVNKDSRKRRKSHDTNSSQGRDEYADDVFKDFSKSGNATDKGSRNVQHNADPWIEKRHPNASVSTSSDHYANEKRNCNKVPPLRLKKVVREGSSDDYRSAEMATGLENEPNYRIVTGATPRPDAVPTSMSNASSWARVMLGNDREPDITPLNQPECDGSSRHSTPMTDGCKLKYQRNRLRQKLHELRGKALDLGQQMANSSGDTNPQHITRLSQMMNCYEKQIENLSKLLNTLSTATPCEDVVHLEEDNARNCCETNKAAADEYETECILRSRSPSLSSPEPPKLSPRSPVDYNENKSPCEVRDTPPVLPRASSILPPVLEPNTDRNSQSGRNSWDEESNKAKVLGPSLEAHSTESRHSTITNSNNGVSERRRSTPSVPRSTSADREGEREVVDVDIDKACLPDVKNPATLNSSRRSSQNLDNTVNSHKFKEKRENKEQATSDDASRSTVPGPVKNGPTAEVDPRSQFKPVAGPMMGSVTGGVAVPKAVRCGDPVYTTMVPTATRIQAPSAMNVLPLQPNYYPSVMPTNNILPGSITENSRPAHKVTSSSNHCGSMECTPAPLTFNQIGSSAGVADNQRNMLPNDNQDTVQANSNQRNDSTRIMAEQFPTLGNWVARMSKKNVSKSKSKLQATVAASHNATENNIRVSSIQLHSSLPQTTPVPVSEGQKVNTSNATSVPRSNIVNVAPQWNSQRWHRLQHQQQRQQQQLLQQVAAAAAPSAALQVPPASRPGFCPPLSVPQFYPNNFPLDPYGGAAFGYPSALYPYASYPFHPRLHSGSQLDGYQIPMQDQLNSQLRSLSLPDKRLPQLQDPTRHYAPDIMKYSGSLPTGAFQHPNALDYDRLRTTTATQGPGLTSLLLPPPRPPLQTAAPANLPRTSPNGYANGNNQFGRRMIPDVVAAAAAAAVVAAASFGRRRDPLSPYSRSDSDGAASAAVADIVANEAPRLSSNNRPNNSNREHAAAAQPLMNSGSLNGSGDDLRLNASYNPLQNLLLDGVPFMRNKTNYGQAPVFPNNAQVSTPSTIVPPPSSRIQMGKSDAGRDDSRRYCETPHLGKVNRSPDTVSNIMCSNCGLPGSMFKCLGCEAAFYCDERCQARHWAVHGEKCPKKMPKLKKVG